ncbi:hypothetical protein DPMN_121574 [Dreissena polymorpha]|uniref:Uncharacterized protein n=1 Tax=Dreissena polymorpha TaxID=45954 RepID=A0A9D4JPN2_DREPO|nr:hypothetical protein DPMN_121574 [Dreissena polymorpha]
MGWDTESTITFYVYRHMRMYQWCTLHCSSVREVCDTEKDVTLLKTAEIVLS